jgi:hypothetical protein
MNALILRLMTLTHVYPVTAQLILLVETAIAALKGHARTLATLQYRFSVLKGLAWHHATVTLPQTRLQIQV